MWRAARLRRSEKLHPVPRIQNPSADRGSRAAALTASIYRNILLFLKPVTELAAEDAELERAASRANLAAIRFQFAGYRLILALRYNPNWHLQPRVSAGHPDGGQWTRIAFLSEGGDPIRLAQGDSLEGYPVDLREEERRGGHAIREHVGKSHRFLMERVRRESVRIIERGDLFSGLAVGSFTSLDSATRLVNATLARHQSIVASVAHGELPQALVSFQFGSVTGYEAYLPTFHSQPYIREPTELQLSLCMTRRLPEASTSGPPIR